MEDFARFRSHFPVLGQYTYLNTAAWGLLHDGLMEWRQEHDLDYLIGGSLMKVKALGILEQTREHLGRFFNCVPGRIALCPNFSLGLNLLLEGMGDSSSILLIEGDYPSLTWPFQSRGMPCTTLERGSDLEDRILTALEDKRVDVLAISLAQWIDGFTISPDFIAGVKEAHPGLLIIADATQYAGAFLLDFDNSGIDVLGASGYKWLLGGNGNGFILLSEGAERQLEVPATGFNSVQADLTRSRDIPIARRLEPGHLDTLNFGSLNESLGLLEDLGMEAVDRYNRNLGGKVRETLGSMGLLGGDIQHRKTHSTIFNIPEGKGRYQLLKGAGIVCSPRGGGIRLSFHCYNSENDLDKLVEVLKTTL